LFDGYIVVCKFVHELHFFVIAGDDENELILASVLHVHDFSDSVGLLFRLSIFCRWGVTILTCARFRLSAMFYIVPFQM
jgi:hypothetical protein